MWQFMRISNRNVSMQSASVDWWAVLVFTAIIIGNILRTTFLYSLALTILIKWREKQIMAVKFLSIAVSAVALVYNRRFKNFRDLI